jgi:hypothetical protein
MLIVAPVICDDVLVYSTGNYQSTGPRARCGLGLAIQDQCHQYCLHNKAHANGHGVERVL